MIHKRYNTILNGLFMNQEEIKMKWLDRLCFNLYFDLALPKYKIIKHTTPEKTWYKIRQCGIIGYEFSGEYECELHARHRIGEMLAKEAERLTNDWYHKTETINY